MLMSSGKIHKANEGCACTMNSILEQFVKHLTLGKDEIALLDMEAGVEHFGRGVDNEVDCILMIVDPSFESLRLTKKIKELGESIHKEVYFVLNKVDVDNISTMQELIAAPNRVLTAIPADLDISKAGLLGEELTMQSLYIQKLAVDILGLQ